MNALMDDPDFFKYLIGSLPIDKIKRAYEEYHEQKTGLTTFERWLETLPTRPDAMLMLRKIYELDQMAKARDEVWAVNFNITKQTPKDPAKRRTDKITTDEIIEFYKFLQ